jgi:NAD(P)-dependent dehydrogenase (short-subunit alcohol dehydrogenase family)
MKIRDSVAFVTGANRRLGLAFTQELLAAGARKVYAAARNPGAITLNGMDRVRLNGTKREITRVAADELVSNALVRSHIMGRKPDEHGYRGIWNDDRPSRWESIYMPYGRKQEASRKTAWF